MTVALAVAVAVALAVAGCNSTDRQNAQTAARAIEAESGTTISQTQPSDVIPPDGSKWQTFDPGGAHFHRLPGGHGGWWAGELRGWLEPAGTAGTAGSGSAAGVSPNCNPDDPDWHYHLAVDSHWAATHGVDLTKLIRAGNMIEFVNDRNAAAFDAVSGTPLIHVELAGWDPSKKGPNAPPDWQTFGTGCNGALWAFNPTHPLSWQPPLQDGQYVRMSGAIITDEPHSGTATIPTDAYRYTGISVSDEGKDNATIDMWAGDRGPDDPDNPARWTEMHSPSIISVLDPPPQNQQETLKSVAVVADNCLTFITCSTKSIDADFSLPGPPPHPGATVGYQELVSPATNFRTIQEGNQSKTGAAVTVLSDHIHVHVAVRGEANEGAKGRFAALYRVYWNP